MNALLAVISMALLLGIAWLASSARHAINWRTVAGAFALQVGIAALVLYVPLGQRALEALSTGVSGLLGYAQEGIAFVFGDIGRFEVGFIFAFHVLPVVIFFSALVAVLYHIGVMGWLIRLIGGGLRRLLGTSTVESMSATANIFVSQTEAPLVVKPYLALMTRSELFAVMVGGMATVAGSVLAGYVALGVELKYLLAASFMAAPGGLLMAKLLVPETETLRSEVQDFNLSRERHVNVIDAAASGAGAGLNLAVNIGAMLLAFVGLIALLNGLLGQLGGLLGLESLSLQLVLNEFVAYAAYYEDRAQLSVHSQAVVSFALCGFANFASIAVLLGGLGTLVPERREQIAQLGLRAVLAGFMANLMSAAIAGFFLSIA